MDPTVCQGRPCIPPEANQGVPGRPVEPIGSTQEVTNRSLRPTQPLPTAAIASAGGVFHLEPLPDDPAVALFISRARARKRVFAVTDADASDIASLVRLLDRMPLAIELAAARAGMMRPKAMLARIGQRFRLLTGGKRGSSARQMTLKGAIDWSWALLTDWEQAAFAQRVLGVLLDAHDAVMEGQGGVAELEGLAGEHRQHVPHPLAPQDGRAAAGVKGHPTRGGRLRRGRLRRGRLRRQRAGVPGAGPAERGAAGPEGARRAHRVAAPGPTVRMAAPRRAVRRGLVLRPQRGPESDRAAGGRPSPQAIR